MATGLCAKRRNRHCRTTNGNGAPLKGAVLTHSLGRISGRARIACPPAINGNPEPALRLPFWASGTCRPLYMPVLEVEVVRTAQFAGVLVLGHRWASSAGVGGAAHATARRRRFFLRERPFQWSSRVSLRHRPNKMARRLTKARAQDDRYGRAYRGWGGVKARAGKGKKPAKIASGIREFVRPAAPEPRSLPTGPCRSPPAAARRARGFTGAAL